MNANADEQPLPGYVAVTPKGPRASTVVAFELNGESVEVPDEGLSLLELLRDGLGTSSVKDGCSPQGQCGCCTVWVDGKARVACVTPAKRVQGRCVTTLEGLADADSWADAFVAAGATQCGFCTPGIIMRLAALAPAAQHDQAAVEKALVAHLCRCTGWQSVVEATVGRQEISTIAVTERDAELASRRAALEGGTPQAVAREAALGLGGFSEDSAPGESIVALLDRGGEWVVGDSLREAREAAGKVPGRRSTAPTAWPLACPSGDWARTLQTTWVEPAYLEPDASWCLPDAEPSSPNGNGGAFGGKRNSDVAEAARRLANEHARPVRALLTREDVVRIAPKRPPVAGGVGSNGTGRLHLARPATPSEEDQLRRDISVVAPDLEVEFADAIGPPVSADIRGAGWVEAAVLMSSLRDGPDRVTSPEGAVATAAIDSSSGTVLVTVRCGAVLDEVVLRSYCVGAAHMALGWVESESLALDDDGIPVDLTIRSFGVLRAVDTPRIEVTIEPDDADPINGSDAVFAAVAAAAWRAKGFPTRWPTG
ncbi:MAG: 2Fe-2S iron-sulfur cluster binding domain-containing protein [Ilumatobacteraceae bacterium]|nr:2Fe-2S iron-sulfur cluster binding domain-containing protein [Ilumatobacteraceae bacterium]